MIIDLRTASDDELRSLPPTVVVGSGAAGIALTLALEAAGRPTVLLESGGGPHDDEDAVELGTLNVGEVAGRRYEGLLGGRPRRLGGATQLWLGQCTRLLPLDLQRRSWVEGSGWPLDPAELDRWYTAAERWFGVAGGGYGVERWQENPAVEPVPWDGEHLEADFTEYTDLLRLGSIHQRRLRMSSSIRVLLHATAVRVVLHDGRASGVEVRDLRGRSTTLAAETVLLACGAVENARLLLLSDAAGHGIGAAREHVGRYLQDHPVVETLRIRPMDPRRFQDRTTTLHGGGRRLYPKVRLTPRAQREHELLNANASFLHYRDDPGVQAARRLLLAAKERRAPKGAAKDVARAVGTLPTAAQTLYRRKLHGVSGGPPADRITLQVWMEQPALAESRITLGESRDPFGLPVARVDWRVGDLEMRTSRALSRWVAQNLRTLGLAEVEELPPMHDDTVWQHEAGDVFHPSGTTRMSSTARDGVVDTDCRVHDVDGLFIAGSSTFPVAGFANPTLTTVALALRLAAHIVATSVPSTER